MKTKNERIRGVVKARDPCDSDAKCRRSCGLSDEACMIDKSEKNESNVRFSENVKSKVVESHRC